MKYSHKHQKYISLKNYHTIIHLNNIEYLIILGNKINFRCKKLTYISEDVLGQKKFVNLKNYKVSSENTYGIIYDASSKIQSSSPSPSLIVQKLNNYYNTITTPSNDAWFPIKSGIILSAMQQNISDSEKVSMSNEILDCVHGDDKINLKTTTYWCPPSINRVKMVQKPNTLTPPPSDTSYIEAGRVSSFSYIRKDLLKKSVYTDIYTTNKYLIYNNEEPVLVSRSNIFCAYADDGYTGANYNICNKTLGIGCRDISCGFNKCKSNYSLWPPSSPCIDFNTFINTNTNVHEIDRGLPLNKYNELLIKTWNYDPSGPTKNGIIDGSWQPAALNSKTFGWSDVSYYSNHKNVPILAYALLVDDKTKNYWDDPIFQKDYNDLSYNLETKFNKNRASPIEWKIGIDLSCLTYKSDTCHIFFDLSSPS